MERKLGQALDMLDAGKQSEALGVLRELAKAGNVDAMTKLAEVLSTAVGADKDVEQSIIWDKRALSLGSSISAYNLGVTYRDLGRTEEAVECFRKAIELGDVDATIPLAEIIFADDPAEARLLLTESLSLNELTPVVRERASMLMKMWR